MTYILQIGNLFVTGFDLRENEGKKELTRVTLSKSYAMRISYEVVNIILDNIDAKVLAVEDSPKMEELNKFLTKRENKLQKIEQLFKNGVVDLEELTKLVKEDK